MDFKNEFAALEKELLEIPAELPAEKPKEKFAIDSTERAEWVVGKMTSLDAKEKLVKDQAAAIQKDIANDKRYIYWRFGNELELWAGKNLPPKKKSVKLLTGTLAFRTVKAKLKLVDKDKAVKWAEENCMDALDYVPTLKMTPVQEHHAKTGEIPPGYEMDDGYESFSVKGA